MAEVQAVKAAHAQQGVVTISGRVHHVRRKTSQRGTLWLTLLKLAAPDQYSSPSTVEVLSEERIGAPGEEVVVACRIGGYARTVTPKDPEAAPYPTADNVLSFVGFA